MAVSHRFTMLHAMARSLAATVLIGGGVGIVATAAASAFVAFVQASERWLVLPLAQGDGTIAGWLPLVALLAGGGLLVGLLRRWNRPATMQGPAHVIAAAHGLERLMPRAAGLRTLLATLVSIGSGASVGQYGPLAHLGGLLGHQIARATGGDAARRNIGLACGVAAAISTAFNAPIAGIVFAHEVVLRHFSLRAFAPVTVASSIGFVFTHFVESHDPLFEFIDPVFVYGPEYLFFAAIGIGGGLIAVVYMRAIFAFERLSRASRVPEVLRPLVAGVVLALIASQVPEVLGVGFGSLRSTLAGAFSPEQLGLVLVAKLVATALCLGFGFVGGVFSPALLIGVVFGTLCGTTFEMSLDTEHSDILTYAACGMVAVVSPVIGAPLTAILLIFELTRSYDVTTAAMLTAVMSNLVSYRVFGRSFFDRQLARNGHDLSMGREKLMLSVRSVRDLVDEDAPAVTAGETAGRARQLMHDADVASLAVVDDDDRVIGSLRLVHMVGAADDAVVDQWITRAVTTLEPDTPVWQAMHVTNRSTAERFPVTAPGGAYAGMVSRRDIVSAYLGVSQSVRAEQHGLV